MSNIMISDLHLTSDSESYLKYLDASEQNIQGGIWPYVGAFLFGAAAYAAGYYSH